jgi:hypothetical protein
VSSGGRTSFRAAASGKLPFFYQWLFNGSPLAGATNPVLVLSDVQHEQAGGYSVVLSNELGQVASANAALSVLDAPPALSRQPVGPKTFLYQPVTLQVIAIGSRPFSYQWSFNGVDLPGATNAILDLGRVNSSQAGNYAVTVRNSVGTVTSATAALAVVPVFAWGDGSYVFGQADVPPGLNGVVAVAAGDYHSLALKRNGTVVAWGSIINVPAHWTNVVAITPALALRADGTVVAMPGSFDVPSGLNNVVTIASGNSHHLALNDDGTVIAWGNNNWGQIDVPSGLRRVIAIAAGGGHSLALQSDGKVVAWGSYSSVPARVPSDVSNVVAIACGENHRLALRRDGPIVAWHHSAEA